MWGRDTGGGRCRSSNSGNCLYRGNGMMNRWSGRSSLIALTIALAGTSTLSPAFAQSVSNAQPTATEDASSMVSEDQTSSGGVEDIVVTAQRRSENLQKEIGRAHV